jgi:hypothetical protein
MPRSASAWCSSSRSWPDSVTPFGPAEYHHIVAGRAGTSRETHYVQIYALTFEPLLIVSLTQAFCSGVGCGPRAHPAADQKGSSPLPTPAALPTLAALPTRVYGDGPAADRAPYQQLGRGQAAGRAEAAPGSIPATRCLRTGDAVGDRNAGFHPGRRCAPRCGSLRCCTRHACVSRFWYSATVACRRRTLRAPRRSARGDRTG